MEQAPTVPAQMAVEATAPTPVETPVKRAAEAGAKETSVKRAAAAAPEATTPAKRGRPAAGDKPLAAEPPTPPAKTEVAPAAKPSHDQQADADLPEDVARSARRKGWIPVLTQLLAHPDAAGKPPAAVLEALKKSKGLLHPAKEILRQGA